MPIHVERDVVLPILYVCPYVQCRYCVKTNGHIVTFFDNQILHGDHSCFLILPLLQNSKGNLLRMGVKCSYVRRILQILPFILKTARDGPIITMKH